MVDIELGRFAMGMSRRWAAVAAVVVVVFGGLVSAAPAGASSGGLDPSFGTGGKVTFASGVGSAATALVLQSDGKPVAAGAAVSSGGSLDFAVFRRTTSGAADPTFGTGGTTTIDLGGDDAATAVASTAGGGFIVAGLTLGSSGADFAVAKLTALGTPDPTFAAPTGHVVTDLSGDDLATSLAVAPDGSAVVAGGNVNAFELARYTPSGALDTTFGAGGKVVTPLGSPAIIGAVALQSDGKIVAAGSSGADMAVARYNANGTPDTTFGGGNGLAVINIGQFDQAVSVLVQSDGALLVVGNTRGFTTSGIALARLLPNGQVDSSYATKGIAVFSAANADVATGATIDGAGRPVVTGGAQCGTAIDASLYRFNGDGSPDTTFGAGGRVTTDFGGVDVSRGVAVQADGNIVTAGATIGDQSVSAAMARYMGTGDQPTPACAPPEDPAAQDITVAATPDPVPAAAAASATGYRLTAADGGMFSFGDAAFLGSTGDIPLNKPIVGMASTPSGRGYWLVASDGGIFSFGDAAFLGSTGNVLLNKPIVGMASTPSGNGYWMVASDGGIFSYGDAAFFGSTGDIHLNEPIVAMSATPAGSGYRLVASDGGIFAFGDAAFFGSTGAVNLNKPIVAMGSTPSGNGYWLVASDGGIFSFGDAPYFGSTGDVPLNKPIVAFAAS